MPINYDTAYPKLERRYFYLLRKNEKLREALEPIKIYAKYCDKLGMSLGGKSLGDILEQALKHDGEGA